MADLFWYELSVSEPELYMCAQAQYLRAVADYLSPAEQSTLPLSALREESLSVTDRLYSPDTHRASLDEQQVKGMKKDFLVVVNELSSDFTRKTSHRRSISMNEPSIPTSKPKIATSKSKFSPSKSKIATKKPKTAKSQSKKPAKRPKKANSPIESKPITELLRKNKPEFVKLIRNGSKPPGDVVSVASSDDSVDIETLFSRSSIMETWERKPPLSDDFRLNAFNSIRKCPFCSTIEDVETEVLSGLPTAARRESKGGGFKDFLVDGSVLVHLPNGDLKHSFPSGQVVYFFHTERVMQALYPHGHSVSVFPSGQVEFQCPQGSKFVRFSDNTAAFVNPDGSLEPM